MMMSPPQPASPTSPHRSVRNLRSASWRANGRIDGLDIAAMVRPRRHRTNGQSPAPGRQFVQGNSYLSAQEEFGAGVPGSLAAMGVIYRTGLVLSSG